MSPGNLLEITPSKGLFSVMMPPRRYDDTNIDNVQFQNNTFYLIEKLCIGARYLTTTKATCYVLGICRPTLCSSVCNAA